jgi:hypothetical protein
LAPEKAKLKRNTNSGFSSRVISLVSSVNIGGVAQLGERLPCTQEAIGSSPFTSTRIKMEVKTGNRITSSLFISFQVKSEKFSER